MDAFPPYPGLHLHAAIVCDPVCIVVAPAVQATHSEFPAVDLYAPIMQALQVPTTEDAFPEKPAAQRQAVIEDPAEFSVVAFAIHEVHCPLLINGL